MRGNSQNGGQTTKSLLIKPQCSGVPIQQAVSLSSSFPRHCLLFVCAFFREMQESAGAEEQSLPPASCIQNRPGFLLWKPGRFVCFRGAFSGAHAKPCEGAFGKPRVCGEKFHPGVTANSIKGSPPRMRGKVARFFVRALQYRITPAYAGKRNASTVTQHTAKDHPRVCGEKHVATSATGTGTGSPPLMRGKVQSIRQNLERVGITPAYAGKSCTSCSWQPRSRDHPRVCGENTKKIP